MNKDSLNQLISRITQSDGDFTTAIPALSVYRRSKPSEPMPCIYGLSLALTVQGGKRITLGDEVIDYGPGQSLVTTVDLPVTAYITHASRQLPFLGLRLELDARLIAQVAAKMDASHSAKNTHPLAISATPLDAGVQDALVRLLGLLNEPALLHTLAPLLEEEIVARLLHGAHGPMLRHLVTQGSPSQQVAKVITWLRHNFDQEVSGDELAAKAHMSGSTFRAHFRNVTGMSPLQYAKNLRLQEARNLMMHSQLDAGSAAIRVGYESASQFSREYRRLFGEPPQRDIQKLRLNALSNAS